MLRIVRSLGAGLGVLLVVPACDLARGCETRHFWVIERAHWLLEGAPPDREVGDVAFDVTITNLETGWTVTDGPAELTPYEDGGWSLRSEGAESLPPEFGFFAPPAGDCVNPYSGVVTFTLHLPDDWPVELLEDRPPITATYTREQFLVTTEVCLWDNWCVDTQLARH